VAIADAAAEVRAERIAALADLLRDVQLGERIEFGPDFTSDIQDPVVELRRIRAKRAQTKTPDYSLFRWSPLTPLHKGFDRAEERIYKATNIKFGSAFNTLFQGLSESLPGEDSFGMVTAMTFVGTWDAYKKGAPNRGEVTFGLDGRWNYGTTGPTNLGFLGLGSLGFTANPFAAYTPTFLVRNLFWRQGSREAGWMYRIGRVTPDSFLATSRHINPLATYLPIVGTGGFTMGLPDSGFGLFAGLFINDRVNLAGVFSDSNADRFTLGDLGAGDYFKALELQVKIAPLSPNAGYSKITFWHNDGTKDGAPINGSTGLEGWGVFIKHEQELTLDGRAVAICRWGQSYRDSALYEEQVGAHFVYYDPFDSGKSKNDLFSADLFGMAYNWVQPTQAGAGDESNVEFFYRFPLFPETDATISYQAVINPSLDPANDVASAISFRLRSTF
jgi:hypothetical protein